DLQIVANGGVDEQWVGRLDTLPVDAQFSPVIDSQVEIPRAGPVELYGLDMAGAPADAAVVSSALAQRLNLRVHSRLALPIGQFQVDRIADAGPLEFIVMDIATAQKALNAYGKVDRIDVTAGPGEDFQPLETTLRKTLPAGYLVAKPGVRK